MFINYLWLPILFVTHDFEEIIIVPSWVKKHSILLSGQKHPLFGGLSNSSILSIGILEELLILIFISIYSMFHPNNSIYFGIMLTYLIHLFLHIIFCIQYHSYVPGIVTSLIQIPICINILKINLSSITLTVIHTILVSSICLLLFFINIIFIHKLMNWISNKNLL